MSEMKKTRSKKKKKKKDRTGRGRREHTVALGEAQGLRSAYPRPASIY